DPVTGHDEHRLRESAGITPERVGGYRGHLAHDREIDSFPSAGDLEDPEITRWYTRRLVGLLRERLPDDERVKVVALSWHSARTLGLVCVTDERILFVERPAFHKPRSVSVALADVADVNVEDRPTIGVLKVKTSEREVTFRMLPKVRAWHFFWTLRK